MTLYPALSRLSESERIAYFNSHHTWPPNWHNESAGYKQLMEQREREIMSIPGTDERWENWMQYISGRYVKSFTKNGYLLAQMPPEIFKKLSDALNDGLKNWDNLREEYKIDVVHTAPGKPSKMIDIGSLANEVHLGLQPLHEAWANGMKLKPTSIYGIRIYQNGSSLLMHCDKV